MHALWLYLWIAPKVLLSVCLIGLFLWRRQRQVPLFVSYVAFELAFFITSITANILVLHSLVSQNIRQWTVTVGTALELALELCVLYELANELILSRSSSARALRGVLRWTAAVFLLVSAVVYALFPQPGLRRVIKVFQALDFSSNLIIVGLLLSLLLFSRVLQISWRSLPSGIALGLGVVASAEIASSSLYSLLGRPGFLTVDLVRMAADHVCVLVWFYYIFFNQEASVIQGTGLEKLELEAWGQELERIGHRWSHL